MGKDISVQKPKQSMDQMLISEPQYWTLRTNIRIDSFGTFDRLGLPAQLRQ
jgi:hypothetical protein